MSNYFWCHGPSCHTHATQDRVRGTKGSKVLRTRKIKVNDNGYPSGFYKYFCSNTCYNSYADKYAEQIIRIAPRTEALETPINDPEKKTYQSSYGNYSYTRTTITKIDNSVD